MMNLYKASQQWSTRPADERFWTLQEMLEACKHYQDIAAESTVLTSDLRVEADNGEVKLVGKTNQPAILTNWSFGQICKSVGAPAGYLRDLPATLAAQNINHGLKTKGMNESETKLLIHKNDDLLVRALTSPKYKRIWNANVLERLMNVLPDGWRVPPARPANNDPRARQATESDVYDGTKIRVGDMIAPAGLYASDHDLFVFLVNPERTVDAGYPDHGLMRGIFMWNSEVGASTFGVAKFFFDYTCGNHIVWDAREYSEIRIRHIGEADSKAFNALRVEMCRYSDESVSDLEAKILAARSLELGVDKESAIDAALAFALKKHIQIPRKTLVAAHDIAVANPRYGSPRTPWALSSGLTELSQQSAFTDERHKLDIAAGKILHMAF